MAVAALAEAGAAMGRSDWLERGRGGGGVPAVVAADAPTGGGCGPGRGAAGPPPGLRHRLRLVGRGLHPAGGGDRAGPAGWPRPARWPTSCCGCSGSAEEGRFFTTGERRRAADRSVQGHLRRRHAVGQLGGRRRPAAAGRPDRGRRATQEAGATVVTRHGAAARPPPGRVHQLPGRRRPDRPGRHRGRGDRASGPTWWPPWRPVTSPTRCWPGVSPTPRRCGRADVTADRGPGVHLPQLHLRRPGRRHRLDAGAARGDVSVAGPGTPVALGDRVSRDGTEDGLGRGRRPCCRLGVITDQVDNDVGTAVAAVENRQLAVEPRLATVRFPIVCWAAQVMSAANGIAVESSGKTVRNPGRRYW